MNWLNLRQFLRQKVYTPTKRLLQQGVTPHKLAMTVAFGAVFGLFPIIGTTTYLCILVAVIFRLNHALIQAINYLVYPIQIMLLIPFLKFGQYFFNSPVPLHWDELITQFQADLWGTLAQLWHILTMGVVGWALLAIPLYFVAYFMLLPIFRKALVAYRNP